MPALPYQTFAEWVAYVFDRPVTSPEWYWDHEHPPIEPDATAAVAYLTQLFTDPTPALDVYSDAQLSQSLWYLMGEGSAYAHAIFDPGVPAERRQACVEAIPLFFERLFARRCTPHLSHLDEPGASPLNVFCYMWWDLFPTWGNPPGGELQAECLAAMAHILELDSVPCRESALHGLGHWAAGHPDAVARIIDHFLARADPLRPELAAYARQARSGCVL